MQQRYTDSDKWVFHRDDEGRWKWQRVADSGEVLLEARSTFEQMRECIADARLNGYSGGSSDF